MHQSSDSNNLETLIQCLEDMEGISPLHKTSCLFFSIHPGSTVELYT